MHTVFASEKTLEARADSPDGLVKLIKFEDFCCQSRPPFFGRSPFYLLWGSENAFAPPTRLIEKKPLQCRPPASAQIQQEKILLLPSWPHLNPEEITELFSSFGGDFDTLDLLLEGVGFFFPLLLFLY